MKKLNMTLITLFILFLIAAFFLQSEWGKGLAQKFLVDALKESGYKVEIATFKGTIPHSIELKGVKIESETLDISVDSLETRLSIWALLKKELLFTNVKASGISWKEKTGVPPSLGKGKGLSFDLKVKHFSFTDVHLPENIKVNFEGALRIGKKNRDFFLELGVSRNDFPESKLHFIAYLDESGSLRLKGFFQSPTLAALPFPTPFDASADLRFALRRKENQFVGRFSGSLAPHSLGFSGPLNPWLETNWKLNGRFSQVADGWQISRLNLISDRLKGNGNGKFDPKGKFETAALVLKSEEPQISFRVDLTAKEEGGVAIKGNAALASLKWQALSFENMQAQAELMWKDEEFAGAGVVSGSIDGKKIEGKTDFSFQQGGSFYLTNASLQGAFLEASGTLEIRPDRIFLGHTDLTIENLQNLPFSFYGKLQGKADWLISNEKQVATFEGIATEFYWKNLFAEKIAIEASLIDPFENPQGRIVMDSESIKWHEMFLDRLRFETLLGTLTWPFALSASGKWVHPLEVVLDGTWHYKDSDWICHLQKASGSFYKHPIELAKPVDFEYFPNLFRLSDLDLNLADARLFLTIEEIENELAAELVLERFPLDILSLNPLDVSISGRTDCTVSIHEKNKKIDGKLKAQIQQMVVATPGEIPPISAFGQFEGSFDHDVLDLKGGLNIRNTPLVSLDLSLPIHFDLHPLQAFLIYDKQAKGRLTLDGRIEEILDFFDLGTHRLEGAVHCDFSLENTLLTPNVKGTLHFDNGYYENYLTGTRLFDIRAEGKANKSQFRLESLTANDEKGIGKEGEKDRLGEIITGPNSHNLSKRGITATGEITLLPSESFPYVFDIAFNRFQIAQIDLVSAEATGKIKIVGNAKGAIAKGEVEVAKSDMHVPDRIPRSFPNLVVVYQNATKPIEQSELASSNPFPLQLDLQVKASEGIFISGRGLDSEWKGNFHVGGTYTSIAAQGKLELLKGEFLFSNRHFKLMDGSLSFTGLEHEMPYLNLTAQTEVKDVSITARLKGPLNNPQLTFQSVPPLPLSTIMSYLLFGQELAEINSFQALQLANSLAAFAGQGPDVLENTRKALGVDRLNIVSVSKDNEELEDAIAVQVGKYVSEGVLVSLTQGAEEASTNISIEIELKGGWVIQLESDQRQEQGKFTIKWNHNS